LNILTKW